MKLIGAFDVSLADITSVVAGTNLSGGGTTGAVTINLADASTSAKGAASFSSDNFAASSGAITIKDGGVDLTAEVTGILPSANMDGDTAHLTTAQTFTGSKTMATDVKLNFRDANSYIHSKTANDLDIFATDIVLDAATSVKIETSDLTMYDPVNDGNPTISLGSSATNRFEIKTAYNSGAQTLDEVYFNTYTASGGGNDGRYIWQVDEVELARLLDDGLNVTGYIANSDTGAFFQTINKTLSSATEGGRLKLICDDGAAMADDHRLGVIEFSGAEDGDANRQTGARIQAMCDAAWSASENGTRLEFYTMDGNAASELSLTLDSDLLATFAGAVTVTGTITGNVTGDLTGNADTATVLAATRAINGVNFNGSAAITIPTNRVYGTYIKLLPNDFLPNEDGGTSKGVHLDDTAPTGLKPGIAAMELVAIQDIPEGFKATHVDIYASTNLVIQAYEMDIDASGITSRSSAGNANTTLDITDVAATDSNFLAIIVTTTATSNRVWGGRITIAPQ